jgi:2-oxoglutarate dehydrogenase complex dehydrogenase (E1) component-like enzyme
LAKRRKEGEAIWADNVVTNAEIEWNKKLQDAKNNAGDGAPNFTGNVLKEWDKFSTNTMKSAPTGSAERILSTHLNNLRQRIIDHAQQFEATERVAKQVRDVEYNVNQKVALAALDPTPTKMEKALLIHGEDERGAGPGNVEPIARPAGPSPLTRGIPPGCPVPQTSL